MNPDLAEARATPATCAACGHTAADHRATCTFCDCTKDREAIREEAGRL